MPIEQINISDTVGVKKKSVEKWTRHDIPQLNASNVSQHLLAMTQSEKAFETFLMQLLQHLVSVTNAMGAVYFTQGGESQDTAKQLQVGPQLLSKELMSTMPDIVGRISEQAVPIVKTQGATTIEMAPFVATIVPIHLSAQQHHVLAAIYSDKNHHGQQLLNNQLISSFIYLWRSYQENKQLNTESFFSSALLELMTLLQQAESKSEFESLLVNQLQSILGCHQVAFGRFKDLGNQFQLSAVSGVSDIDTRNQFKSQLESCAFEAKQFGKTVALAQRSSVKQEESLLISHQGLLEQREAEYVISKILQGPDEEDIGALVCWWPKTPNDIQLKQQFIEAANGPLCSSIVFVNDKASSLLNTYQKSPWFRYKFLLITLLSAVVLAFSFFPIEHKVVSHVSIEPVFQRIVSTRYDGVLKEVLVKPGAQVQKGQVLAFLDDQDLLIRQRSLQAEYDTAIKDRNLKVAAAKVSEAQIANLEIQRLSLELQLVEDQLNDLSIIAPIAGSVISEHIDRRQGSLLKKGEILFELAPLEKMYAELAIPAEDISHVKTPSSLLIHLDALPTREWHGSLDNIQPRSVVVDSENVFLAKVSLENDENTALKPGMRGQASITIGQRSLGWVLLHKAMNRISRWFSMMFNSPSQ